MGKRHPRFEMKVITTTGRGPRRKKILCMRCGKPLKRVSATRHSGDKITIVGILVCLECPPYDNHDPYTGELCP